MRRAASSVRLADIAQRAGVSTATVSRMLNNTAAVSAPVRTRIEQVMQAAAYQRPTPARPHSQDTITVITGSLSYPYYGEVVDAIEDAADTSDVTVSLHTLGGQPERQLQHVQHLSRKTTEGVIMIGVHPRPEVLQWLEHERLPLVLINRGVDHPHVFCIMADFDGAIRRAVQHLISLGHTRIGHIGRFSNELGAIRRRFVEAALAEAGLELPPQWCLPAPPGPVIDSAFRTMSKLLDLPADERPTAMLAMDDAAAMGILHAVWAHGLSAPEDMSVIGMDDVFFASHTWPPLTTISQPKAQLGKVALQTLIQMYNGHLQPDSGHAFLEAPLIVRGSTAPPASVKLGSPANLRHELVV